MREELFIEGASRDNQVTIVTARRTEVLMANKAEPLKKRCACGGPRTIEYLRLRPDPDHPDDPEYRFRTEVVRCKGRGRCNKVTTRKVYPYLLSGVFPGKPE